MKERKGDVRREARRVKEIGEECRRGEEGEGRKDKTGKGVEKRGRKGSSCAANKYRNSKFDQFLNLRGPVPIPLFADQCHIFARESAHMVYSSTPNFALVVPARGEKLLQYRDI